MDNYDRPIRIAALAVLATALAATSGCGSSHDAAKTSTSGSNTYLYVGPSAIEQLLVQDDGTLTPLTPAVEGTHDLFSSGSIVAVGPAYEYLFATTLEEGIPTIIQYVIGSDGTLALNTIPTFIQNADGPSPFVFTPDGKFAVAPTEIDRACFPGMLNTYSLSSSGTLSFASQTSLPGGACQVGSPALAVDSSGSFAYVLCYPSTYGICEFSISPNGTISPLSPAQVLMEGLAEAFTVAPNGFLYTVNDDGTVTAFAIDESTGQLTEAGIFATGTGTTGGGLSIAFNPAGTYAYVTNINDNSVTQFTVDASSGALTTNGPDVATGIEPEQIAVDPSGKFAFVANYSDRTVSQFVIGSTGTLTPNGTFSLGEDLSPSVMTFAQR
jgi:6-phosphogluconolactonase